VGIIGASEVGRRVLRLLRPYGARLLVADPFLSAGQAVELGASQCNDLVELCRQSLVVSLHTPYLPSTHHLLKTVHFQALADDAVLINTSRGACLDEAALIAELEKGRLTACLDVSDPEPAAADSPLRRLPNVHLSSHIAGPATRNLGRQAADDVAAFLAGGRPLAVVTRDMLERIA
jgi:phosphoglycerate dehydrogenase-like enzyme